MQAKYNDYEKTVHGYLKNYHILQAQTKNKTEEIRILLEQIDALTDAKTARYGNDSGGGYDELSQAERIFARKQELDRKLYNAKINLNNIALMLIRVNNALAYLDPQKKQIVMLKFLEKKSWPQIAAETHTHERNCQRIVRKAIAEMAGIIFPESLAQSRLDFVFFTNTCG